MAAIRSDRWLSQAAGRLAQAGISSARLDCLVLLEDATGRDRGWWLAHPEQPLAASVIGLLDAQLQRRAGHEPLAYIRGRSEFYGRSFYVDRHVLEPRPESEAMIELLKSLGLPPEAILADVGTGSGALAITALLELVWPAGQVMATDIDTVCLRVARRNAISLQAPVKFLAADLLQRPNGTHVHADVVLANLPYVPDDLPINLAAGHEPRLAIFGGPDGLDLYRRLFGQLAVAGTDQPGFVLTEALPPQHDGLAAVAASYGYVQRTRDGLVQLFVPTA